METLFSPTTFQKTMDRLKNLEISSQAAWGKMNVAQMLNHCQRPFEVILEHDDHGLKPNLLAKLFFKKAMYNDRLWGSSIF